VKVAAAAILILSALPGRADADDSCTKRELRARGTTTITVDPARHEMRKQFGYYFADSQLRFVLFFKPEDVLALVEKSEQQEVIDAMRRDLPLDRDTDLFKYALRNSHFEHHVIDLLTDLLDAGKVFVDISGVHHPGKTPPDPNDQIDPRVIKRVNWATRGADGRTYCTDWGLKLLEITDMIYD